MSQGIITREYTMWCNTEDCGTWHQDSENNSAKEFAREMTKGVHGWRKIKGKFYCPNCAGTARKGDYDPMLDIINPFGEEQ